MSTNQCTQSQAHRVRRRKNHIFPKRVSRWWQFAKMFYLFSKTQNRRGAQNHLGTWLNLLSTLTQTRLAAKRCPSFVNILALIGIFGSTYIYIYIYIYILCVLAIHTSSTYCTYCSYYTCCTYRTYCTYWTSCTYCTYWTVFCTYCTVLYRTDSAGGSHSNRNICVHTCVYIDI